MLESVVKSSSGFFKERLFTYTQAWQFIYFIYNGKSLLQVCYKPYHVFMVEQLIMTKQQSTCFTTNNPLCSVSKLSENICQASIEIKEYFVVLSRVMQKLYETGLQGVPKIHKAMKSMYKHLAHFKV